MKSIITTLFIAACSMTAFSQSAKYHDTMLKMLSEMDTIHTGDQFIGIANKFERVALAEKNQWQPYYYAALCRTTGSFIAQDNSKTDGLMDVAQHFLDKADSLSPNNAEVYILKSMILGARIMVDPMTRGQQYGMQSMMMLSKAMQLDPNNPRADYIMGQSLFYTPEQFGGGKDKGCALFKTAKEKYGVFKPATDIDPNWGEDQVDEALKQCN